MPRSPQLVIFMQTTTDTDRFTPCACTRGNKSSYMHCVYVGVGGGGGRELTAYLCQVSPDTQTDSKVHVCYVVCYAISGVWFPICCCVVLT